MNNDPKNTGANEAPKEGKRSIFRSQALERVTSPEELDRYLMVTRPGVWFALIAIILLLIAFLTWAALGKIETTVSIPVLSQEGQVICFVPEQSAEAVIERGTISIEGAEYAVRDAGYAKQVLTDTADSATLTVNEISPTDIYLPLAVEADLPDGLFVGSAVTESVKPISFILN